MSDEFEMMPDANDDPAADFLARESEELGELGEELGLSTTQAPTYFIEPDINEEGDFGQSSVFGYDSSANPFLREEPESMKKWRLEHEARLRERDEEEEKRKTELRAQAQKELADWYRHYEENLSKMMALNREKSKDFVAEVDEIVPGQEWDRVSKLCNFNVKSGIKHNKDVTRLKSIMLQLKQNPIAMKYDAA